MSLYYIARCCDLARLRLNKARSNLRSLRLGMLMPVACVAGMSLMGRVERVELGA